MTMTITKARREEIRRKMLAQFAEMDAAPAKEFKRLKDEMVDAHPDKGGSSERFIRARATFVGHRSETEKEAQRLAEARQRRERRSAAARAAWQRKKGKQP
jgi:hypothetical protein